MTNTYLIHHGIKGMHWGVRRYQNPDGSLTAEGKAKYGTKDNYQKARQAAMQNRKNNIRKIKKAGRVVSAASLAVIGGVAVSKAVKSSAVKTGMKTFKSIMKDSGKEFVSGLPRTISKAGLDATLVMLTGSLIYGFENTTNKASKPAKHGSKIVTYGRQPQKKK